MSGGPPRTRVGLWLRIATTAAILVPVVAIAGVATAAMTAGVTHEPGTAPSFLYLGIALVGGAFLAFVGWLVKQVWQQPVAALTEDISALREVIADFREDMRGYGNGLGDLRERVSNHDVQIGALEKHKDAAAIKLTEHDIKLAALVPSRGDP